MEKIHEFIEGFKAFQDVYFNREKALFSRLREGQHPSSLVVACCDSRTDPSLILQCEPGDIFVVRNIANIVPPYAPDRGVHGVSAAVEYAVLTLQVENIIILGHSGCGGCNALLQDDPACQGEFVGRWVNILRPAREQVLQTFSPDDERAGPALEMAGVLTSLDNLMTFPWVAERVRNRVLHLHGWYFDLGSGQLLSYDWDAKRFEPLVEKASEGAGQSE